MRKAFSYVVDVGSEVLGVEEKCEFAILDFSPTVVELCGCGQSDGMGRADRIEFICTFFAVVLEEVLEIVDKTLNISNLKSDCD